MNEADVRDALRLLEKAHGDTGADAFALVHYIKGAANYLMHFFGEIDDKLGPDGYPTDAVDVDDLIRDWYWAERFERAYP